MNGDISEYNYITITDKRWLVDEIGFYFSDSTALFWGWSSRTGNPVLNQVILGEFPQTNALGCAGMCWDVLEEDIHQAGFCSLEICGSILKTPGRMLIIFYRINIYPPVN